MNDWLITTHEINNGNIMVICVWCIAIGFLYNAYINSKR